MPISSPGRRCRSTAGSTCTEAQTAGALTSAVTAALSTTWRTTDRQPSDRPRLDVRQEGATRMNAPRIPVSPSDRAKFRRSGWRRCHRRRPVARRVRRGAGGNPRRAAGQSGDLHPRSALHAGPATGLREALGRDPSASVHARDAGLSGDPGDHQKAHRQEEFRRLVAHRSDVLAVSGDGDDAVRAGGAVGRRRHAVHQSVPRLRGAVGRHEGARRTAAHGVRRR